MKEEQINYLDTIHGKKAWYGIYQAAAGNYCVDNDMNDDYWIGFDSLEEARQFVKEMDEED